MNPKVIVSVFAFELDRWNRQQAQYEASQAYKNIKKRKSFKKSRKRK